MDDKNKLFYVYIGGTATDRLIEDHEVIFVVAQNSFDAKQIAKEKTKLKIDTHVDIMAQLINVDGYNIKLKKSDSTEKIVKVSEYTKF